MSIFHYTKSSRWRRKTQLSPSGLRQKAGSLSAQTRTSLFSPRNWKCCKHSLAVEKSCPHQALRVLLFLRERIEVRELFIHHVILSEPKNLRSFIPTATKERARDVGKPGHMLRISLRRCAQHDRGTERASCFSVRSTLGIRRCRAMRVAGLVCECLWTTRAIVSHRRQMRAGLAR